LRLLTVVAPGGEDSRAAVSTALAAWTRGLDIRLRFLNIGVEEEVLALPVPGNALAAVEEALARRRPAVVLLHGGGPAALAAAVSAGKAGVPVVRTAAGLREGASGDEERAADRLSASLLARDGGGLRALAAEGLAAEAFTPEAAVRAVIRLQRDS
jgi:UDP-N-acetylglucosamine 2-epimerase